MKIPQEQLFEALRLAEEDCSNPGFCLSCGEEQDGCEPDARGYECESCGAMKVCGAAEILLMGEYE